MDRLPSRRILVYLIFGCLVLVGGVWGLTTSGGSAGASEVLVVQDGEQGDGGQAPSGAGGLNPGGAGQDAAGPSGGGSTTTEPAPIFVQVAGAVRRPGVYQVPAGCRVYEAIEKAGGASDEADQETLTLAAAVADGARIYVPRHGEAAPTVPPASSPASAAHTDPSAPLSLNAATQAELEELPDIGPATAQRILAHREENGPFQSVDELDDVSGIGPALMEQLRPLVVP